MERAIVEKSLARVGYAMYYKGYSKEELDNMKDFEIVMLDNEFSNWLINKVWESEEN